jgi:hypothetical protein
VDSFGAKLKRFAAVGAAAAAVGVAILAKETWDFAAASMEAAKEAKVSEDRLRNVTKQMGLTRGEYKGATDRVLEYSGALSKALGVEDETIQAVQTKLATFGELTTSINDAGGAFDRATQAAFDLASAGFGTAEGNAIQLGKALNDPIKGLASLAKSGVTFTDAEKARIATLVESNKIGEAQALVLAAIEKQVGGTAEATATASDKMGVAWGELQESVGKALLPAFEDFATVITEDVVPILEDLWKDVAPGVKGALKDFADWFKGPGVQAIKDFAEWLKTDGKDAWDAMTVYVGEVGTALGLIVGDIDRVKASFGGGGKGDTGLAGILTNVGNAFAWVNENQLLWAGWKRIPGLVNAAADAFIAVKEAIEGFIKWTDDISATVDKVWADIGKAIVDGFARGIGPLGAAIEVTKTMFNSLPVGVKSFFGIQSPSRVFIEIGGNIVKGFEIGVSGLKGVVDATASKFGELADKVGGQIDNMVDVARDRMAAAKEAFASMAADVRDALVGNLELTVTEGGAFDPEAWASSVKTNTDWAAALRDIANNPSFSNGLVTMLADMGPGAGLAFVQSLTPAMVAQLNTDLANVNLISEEAAAAMSERFHGQGVRDAQAHMDGLGERINERLDWLYDQGRRMGLAVSRGYRDATASMLESGARAARAADARAFGSGSTVNVTVQAGIGNPIEIARTIESVLAAKNARLGVA